jgi:hypothetical protein
VFNDVNAIIHVGEKQPLTKVKQDKSIEVTVQIKLGQKVPTTQLNLGKHIAVIHNAARNKLFIFILLPTQVKFGKHKVDRHVRHVMQIAPVTLVRHGMFNVHILPLNN